MNNIKLTFIHNSNVNMRDRKRDRLKKLKKIIKKKKKRTTPKNHVSSMEYLQRRKFSYFLSEREREREREIERESER